MGKLKGTVVVMQLMGQMPDGKLHFVAGQDEDTFNIEEGDKFFTAVFTVDPFKEQD